MKYLHAAADGAEPLDVIPVKRPVDQRRYVRGEALQSEHGRETTKQEGKQENSNSKTTELEVSPNGATRLRNSQPKPSRALIRTTTYVCSLFCHVMSCQPNEQQSRLQRHLLQARVRERYVIRNGTQQRQKNPILSLLGVPLALTICNQFNRFGEPNTFGIAINATKYIQGVSPSQPQLKQAVK